MKLSLKTLPVSNDPNRAGEPANRKELFGEFSRYAVQAFHSRFGICWFVSDAQTIDPVCDLPAVIRQEDTRAAAVAGLE